MNSRDNIKITSSVQKRIEADSGDPRYVPWTTARRYRIAPKARIRKSSSVESGYVPSPQDPE